MLANAAASSLLLALLAAPAASSSLLLLLPRRVHHRQSGYCPFHHHRKTEGRQANGHAICCCLYSTRKTDRGMHISCSPLSLYHRHCPGEGRIRAIPAAVVGGDALRIRTSNGPPQVRPAGTRPGRLRAQRRAALARGCGGSGRRRRLKEEAWWRRSREEERRGEAPHESGRGVRDRFRVIPLIWRYRCIPDLG
jgi:hypothetical protein